MHIILTVMDEERGIDIVVHSKIERIEENGTKYKMKTHDSRIRRLPIEEEFGSLKDLEESINDNVDSVIEEIFVTAKEQE